MSTKIAIIGAGISGLTIANLLQDHGKDVIVFEKSSFPGGLVKCTKEEGVLFHRVGGHVFNSRNTVVLDWFWSKFDKEKSFIKAKRNAKILINNKILGYPLENNIFMLPEESIRSIISQLLNTTLKKKECQNFKDFLEHNFGKTLYDLYFKPYNEKIWNVDLTTVPLPWLEGKLPMPDVLDIIVNNITKNEESHMVHSSFFYPHTNGSQFIADSLAKGLNLQCSETILELEFKTKNKWIVNGDNFDQVVYTGDIRELEKILKSRHTLPNVDNFRSNGTTTVLCSHEQNDYSWLYIPSPSLRPHRIINTGNFSHNNNSEFYPYTCTIEFSGNVDYSTINNNLKKLPGNIKPIAINHEPNSYVIQNFGTRKSVAAIKSKLEPFGLYMLGRFAEWEYYNMDAAMESAMKLTNKIINFKGN